MGRIYLLHCRPTHCLWGQYIYYIVSPPIAYGDNIFTTSSAHPLPMGTIHVLLGRPTHRLWGQYIYYIVGPPIAYWDNSFTRLSAHPLAMVTIYLLHSQPTHRLWGPYIVGPPILYDYNIYVGRRPLAHLRCNIVRVSLSIFYGTKQPDSVPR